MKVVIDTDDGERTIRSNLAAAFGAFQPAPGHMGADGAVGAHAAPALTGAMPGASPDVEDRAADGGLQRAVDEVRALIRSLPSAGTAASTARPPASGRAQATTA